jgi:hypothetical protein
VRRPAGCNSDGAARARVGVPTRSAVPSSRPSAMAGGTRDRCRGECYGTEDTADHHGRLASTVTVTNREITKHRL